MDNYKISIITPVYNCDQYLPQLFDSLTKQTIGFNYLQIIFIDDNSDDNSVDLIKSFSNEKPNVSLHRLNSNSGTAGTPRNVGLENATADYIMFVDADDWLADNACKSLYEAINISEVDIVSGYHHFIDEARNNQIIEAPQYQNLSHRILNLPHDIEEAFILRSHWSNKIYKTKLIQAHNITFNTDNPGEDLIFFTQYLLQCKSFEYIDELILFYRLRRKGNKSISNLYNKKYFLDARDYLDIMYSILVQQNDLTSLFSILIEETFPTLIMNLIDTNELPDIEKAEVLQLFDGVFSFLKHQNLLSEHAYISALADVIALRDIPLALHVLQAIQVFRHETQMALEGKDWLEGQVENQQADFKNLELHVEQLEKFIDTQQQNIAWLEGQVENHKAALENLKSFVEQKENIIVAQQQNISRLEEQVETQETSIENLRRGEEN